MLPADRRGSSRRWLIVALALVAGGAVLWVVGSGSSVPDLGWWRGAGSPAPVRDDPPPRDPGALYRDECLPCHALGGEGGTYGPDLGEAGRRLTSALVAAYVRAPAAVDPGSRMPPARGLTPTEIDSLAAWVVERARADSTP